MKKHQPLKNCRLTDQDRAEIRELRRIRPWLWSYQALAEHYGTTRWTVMRICKGEK